jgi:glycosyltransferase involved in cell wall biosynthesis
MMNSCDVDRDHDSSPILAVSVVVPAFNEEDTVGLFVARVLELTKANESLEVELIFVNDGSSDKTLERLLALRERNSWIKVIELSRNFGKEALTAGLQAATGRVIIPMDVDLQDPPELIPKMVERWRQGFDVVLAQRINRQSDTLAKKLTAGWFYKVHNLLSEVQIPQNVGDFRLMDRQVVNALMELPESCRFMKGMFAWVGFRTSTVGYERGPRVAGTGKFNGWRLWNFAVQGITGFSTAPLRIWTYLGVLVAAMALSWGGYILIRTLVKGIDVPGYASLLVAVMFLGGVQLIGIGVLGEYVGRAYIETKRRPTYIIRRIYSSDSKHPQLRDGDELA